MTRFDEKSQEIEQLKGEMAASTAAIVFLFKIVIDLGGGGRLPFHYYFQDQQLSHR